MHGDGDNVDHAQLSWPLGGGIMIGSARDNPDDPWSVQPGTTGCYVVTDNPAQLHARAVAAGAEITDPVHETDYGSRDFANACKGCSVVGEGNAFGYALGADPGPQIGECL